MQHEQYIKKKYMKIEWTRKYYTVRAKEANSVRVKARTFVTTKNLSYGEKKCISRCKENGAIKRLTLQPIVSSNYHFNASGAQL
jgi:NAD-dependent dihydropyrimidine dehydrogenase PreA subunit